jgi:RHS repeat-associated protein
VTDTGGGTTSFTYSTLNQLLTITDPRGEVTTNTYNSSGQVATQTDPLGHKTSFSYSGTYPNLVTTVTDPLGNVTQLTYQYGLLTQMVNAYGTSSAAVWSYLYDPNSLGLTSETDPNGNVTTYTYDSHGDLLTETDPLGHTTTYTYNSMDEPLTATDALGVTTTYTYDQYGNQLTASTPLVGSGQTATTTHTYSSTYPGEALTVTDPDGNTTTYTYDQYGDPTSEVTPLGEETTWTYNNIGQLLTSVSPRGNVTGGTPSQFTTTYTYNGLGEETSVTNPLGDKTSYTYDADGNQTVVTDPVGNTTTTVYNADNEPTSVSTANSAGTVLQTNSTTYDADGNELTVTDGMGDVTTYTYNPLNQVSSVTNPLNEKTSYTYDGDGNLLTTTDPSGRVTTDAYNADDELTSRSYSSSSSLAVSYTYDADGRRLTMTDVTGTTTYTWNSLHQLTSVTDGAGAVVTYGYDLAGNETSIAYPGMGTVTRGLNADEELTSVKDWLGNTTHLSYDVDGDLTSIAYPGGVTESWTYGDSDQVTGITDVSGSTTLLSESYTHNSDSLLSGQNSSTVTYTGLDEVGSSDLDSSMSDYYTYDAAGRLTKVACATNVSGTYNAGSELTTQTTGSAVTKFAYDAEGDRTSTTPPSGTASSYTYDQEGRLTAVSGPTTASYVYNGDGLRMSKTVNGTVTTYDWDQSGNVSLLIEAGGTDFIYGPGWLTLEQISGSSADYFLHNWQGTTVGLVSSSGSQVASYGYDAYGNLTSSSGSVSTPLLFQGQYRDAETGFYYLQARYYDPSTAQFLTPDRLNALVPYQYTLGDPVNASDPSGEMITRGTVGSVSGPTAVAPPPATDQAAYYHQVDKETATRPAATAPAPSTAPAASPGPVVSVLKGISTGSALVAAGSGTVALASLASAAVAILVAPYGPGEAADIGFVPLAGAAEQVALYAAGVSCAANVGLDLLHQGDATDTGLTCAGAAAAGSGIAANAAWDSKLAGGLFFGPEATSAAIAGVSGAVWDWLNSPAPSPMGGGGYNNRW